MAQEGKEQQCIEIAEDVLKQLDCAAYVEIRGTYIDWNYKILFQDNESVKKGIERIPPRRCRVCAIGAATLSAARLFNGVIFSDIEGDGKFHFLREFFTEQEVHDLEAAYEGFTPFSVTVENYRIIDALKEFSDKLRFRLVWQTVIDNNGRFLLSEIKLPGKAKVA